MSYDESEAVGEWCARRPLAVVVLHAHRIEAGDPARALAACCRDAGAEPGPLLAEVAAAEAALVAPWRAASPGELIDHVVRSYHRPFPDELRGLDAAIAAAATAEPTAAWPALRGLLAELAADMQLHMAKEERVLFPWLRGSAHTAAAPIRAMQLEHADTIATVRAIHAAAARCGAPELGDERGAVARRLAGVVRRLCEHIHLEANELFPRALDGARRPG